MAWTAAHIFFETILKVAENSLPLRERACVSMSNTQRESSPVYRLGFLLMCEQI